MAYDEELADRVREALAATRGLTEKKMFGGIGFMVNGNMCVGVSHDHLLMRADPDEGAKLISKDRNVRPMEMGGRTMTAFLYVAPEAVKTAAGLKKYVAAALATVARMPPKAPKKAAKKTGAKKARR